MLSGVAMAADWLLLFEAYTRVGGSLGMLINYCGPVLVVALSPVFLGESISPAGVSALAVALVGACLVGGGALTMGRDPVGILCAVLSAFSYAAMVLCSKRSRITSAWEREGEKITHRFTVPAGTRALIRLPGQEEKEVGGGSYEF